MLDNGRISSLQLVFLLLITEGATTVLYSPSIAARLGGPDAWLASNLLPTLYALAIMGVVLALARRFPFQVFTEYLPAIVGKIPGKLLAAAYAVFFIQITSVIMTEGTALIHVTDYPATPVLVLNIVWATVAAYGAYLGIECIARQNQLVWPVWVFVLMLIFLLSASDLRIDNLKPVLENGLLPVIRGGIVRSPWRGYVFFLLMLFPYLNRKQEALKATLLHLALAAFASGFGMFVIIGVLGDKIAAQAVYPFYTLAQYIAVGRFLERMEILAVIIWVAGVAVKLAVFYHSAAIATASVIGLKNYRTTLIPIAVIMVILSSVLYDTNLKLVTFLFTTYPLYAFIIELAVPALILLIAVIRKSRGDPAADV